MKTRLTILIFSMAATIFAAEPIDALKSLPAPGEEFVRMPAKYILQKLERTADGSGVAALQNFKVDSQLEGLGDQRVSINLEGMNLFQALEAVAKATGSAVDYRSGGAVLMDPADLVPEVEAEPVAEDESTAGRKKKKAGRIGFTDINLALVFVENGDGRGSGFIARMNGKTYVFSNQHNLLGATQPRLRAMNGHYLNPSAFEFCRTRDLVRLEIPEGEFAELAVLELSDSTPNIGQEISVYGNSAGGGVATELLGDVVGVGPSNIEIDADIVSGNSGSPILDASGKVLGVATYITLERKFDKNDPRAKIFKGTRFNDARRYGVRIPANGWVQTSVKDYLRQTYVVVDMQSYLEALYILVQHWIENDDFSVPASRLISAYSKIGAVKDAPYEFRESKMEEQLQMTVRAYQKNHFEMEGEFDELSTSEKDALGGRISHLLLKSVKGAQKTLGETPWASDYLEESVRPLEKLADELIDVLESKQNPYIRHQRKRSKLL